MKQLARMMALMVTIAMGFTVHATTSKYYGLFVGVNKYESRRLDYLLGCDWDAMRMMDAYTRGGFCAAENAEMIVNQNATKEDVRAKFSALAEKAVSGDTVIYYQSSHGGDYDDDKGSYICMTDDDWTDTEFAADLAQFADGVRVIVVIDACYSGGMFKSANGGSSMGKKAKWNFAARVQRRLNAHRVAVKAARTKGVPSVAWITAADWNETASMDNRGSEFTHAMLAGWEKGSADTDTDGSVSFGELAEYAKQHVFDSSVQSDNDVLLAETLAGQKYDVDTFRLLSANNVLYGFLGECPASVDVPAGTTSIAASAFDADYNAVDDLESVSIPASVTSIADYAFNGCEKLETVTFAGDRDAVVMGVDAFWGTPYLTSLPFRLLIDEDGCLYGFEGIVPAELDIPDTVTGIEDDVFYGCEELTSVTIPASCEYVGESAFGDCTSLERVRFLADDSMQDTCLEIYEMAFWGCEALTTVSFDDRPYDPENDIWNSIDVYDNAFDGCEALTDLYLGMGVEEIGESAFYGIGIESLAIPASCYYIGDYAFEDCVLLEQVIFLADDSMRDTELEVGENAFSGCEALTTVSFDDRPYDQENDIWNCISIYESAFDGCEALTDLYLGMGVEEIGEYAFYGIGIESLVIPASCYGIGDYAFADCENLADVYFYGEDVYGKDYELDVDIESAFEDTPWLTAVPANDNFADAQELAGESGYVAGRNRNATVEVGEKHVCYPTATVWYKWTAPMSGTVLFGVDANYDSIIGVYAGKSVSSLERIAFNDDSDYYSSVVAFDAAAGETYYIAVGGYEDSEGTFYLEWEPYEYDIEFLIEDGVLMGFDYDMVMPPTLTIPEGVTNIAEWAFEEYGGIVTVNLPSTLKSISACAFAWCYSLTTVNGLTDAIEVGKKAFSATPFDETRPFGLDIVDRCVVGFHGPCAATVTIPEGVTNIAEEAFGFWEYCREEEAYDEVEGEWYEYDVCSLTNLTAVTIPASVASIGEWAFEDCTNLVSVAIGNPEIKIDGSAFHGCEKLAVNIEEEGYALVGWDLYREKNPQRWVGQWDDDGNWIGSKLEEYEPDFMPTGKVVRVADITPLVYGMPTDQLQTNLVWNAELEKDEIESVVVITNNLEGVWATPVWEVNRYTLTFDSDGGSEVTPITQDYGTAVTPPADPKLPGYTFAGWNPAVPEKMPAENMTLTAQWTPNRYKVTFYANGGAGTMAAQEFVYDEEQLLSECAFVRPAYEFLGWSLAADSDDIAFFDGENVLNLTSLAGDNITFYAVWERTSLWTPVGGRNPAGGVVNPGGAAMSGDEAMTGDAAEFYDGYVQTADGRVVGTIQVKVAKAKLNKKIQLLSAKVTVTIQLLGEKKQTIKGNIDVATGAFSGKDGLGRELNLLLGANSLSGTYGPYVIDGAQNKFKTKKAAAKALGNAALAQRQGTWSVAWQDATGWNGVSLTVAAKGKVKIAGVLANGTKVSATSQLLVGEGAVCVIPVVITKKASLAFNVWLTEAGVEVVGMDGDVVAGRVNALKAGAAFNLDAAAFTAYWQKAALPYLPDGVPVAQSGTKWVVASGAKAGKVILKKGTEEVDEEKLGANPSGLKFTYTAKTGTFKGSFKAYVLEGGKPKATTVNVTGVLVNGVGYGTVAIKKVAGGVPVKVE